MVDLLKELEEKIDLLSTHALSNAAGEVEKEVLARLQVMQKKIAGVVKQAKQSVTE